MYPGTTASLICPACGQAFLCMQQSMEGMVQCPHCAHNAQRPFFGTQAQVAGIMQVRRRVSQAPQPQNLPVLVFQPPQSVPSPATQPTWQPQWQEHAPQASIARPMLQPSSALMPVGAPPPPPQEYDAMPQHLRTSPWRGAFILLALLVVSAAAGWVWWEHSKKPAVVVKIENEQREALKRPPQPAAAAPEVRKAQVVTPAQAAVVLEDPPDEVAFAKDAKALVDALFAATTPEDRAACIHQSDKFSAQIEGLFGPTAAAKMEIRVLARLPGLPKMLPGGRLTPLFKLVTSACRNGALVRLEEGKDGKRRIFWPLFFETHQGSLKTFLQGTSDKTDWHYVGMRPSHGLEIPAELRTKYITFDVQTHAGADAPFVGCVERDTPLGRFLDRETEWGNAYLSRLFVRKLDIKSDSPCLVIVDCEGAKEGGAGL